jgi:hypothetical protein
MWRFSSAPFGAEAPLRLPALLTGGWISRQRALAALRRVKRFAAPLFGAASLGARMARQSAFSLFAEPPPGFALRAFAGSAQRLTLSLLRSTRPTAQLTLSLFSTRAVRRLT